MIPLRNLKRFFQKAVRQPCYAARVFCRRSRASWAYAFGRGRSCAPEAITLYLTSRCNLRCKMCGQWGDGGAYRKSEGGGRREEGRQETGIAYDLRPEHVQKLLNEISHYQPNITLFGGEPMLHPACVDIIRAVKERGMHCLMITNGSLLEEKAGQIAESGLDELNVSIDGPRQVHDRIRGLDGLYDTVMRGLSRVRDARGNRKMLVNIQCTISGHNQHHLKDMIDVAAQAGADSLTFHHLIFLGREAVDAQKAYDRQFGNCSSGWEGFVFPPDVDPDVVWEAIEAVSRGKRGFSFDVYPQFSQCEMRSYYAGTYSGFGNRCFSPWITAYVFPGGEVKPCLNFSYSFGNIESASLIEIWNSPRAMDYRRRLKKEKIFPACARCTELYRY